MNPHVPDIVWGGCDVVQLVQDVVIRLQLARLEHGSTAALLIFAVNSAHVWAVEVDPLKEP